MACLSQNHTDRWALYCGDSLEVLPTLPAGSIHLSLYSPPFAGLYVYSSSDRDLSNCSSYPEFFTHYAFFVRELHRLTMPGRMTAVHAMDVPSGNSGGDHLKDFPGDIIRLHEREGWFYTGRYHVWKEPLMVRNRTLSKGLAHRTIVEDSSRCSVASADYLLLFRRKGENPVPIAHPNGFCSVARVGRRWSALSTAHQTLRRPTHLACDQGPRREAQPRGAGAAASAETSETRGPHLLNQRSKKLGKSTKPGGDGASEVDETMMDERRA